MKVVRNSADRLVLREIPLGLGALLLTVSVLPVLWGLALFRAGEAAGGIVLCAIGLLLFFGCFGAFVKVLHVTLDRPRDVVEICETGIFGRRRQAHVLKDLQGATLQSTVIRRKPGDLGEGNRTYRRSPEPRVWRAALVHRNGHQLPLSQTYGSERAAQAAAAAINAWFATTHSG